MRVLLVSPPSPTGTTINREGAAGLGNRYESVGAFLYPPQILATAAALLRDAGHEPALLDATAEQLSVQETLRRIKTRLPDIIAVTLSWSGWENDLAFCASLRVAVPDIPIITLGTVLRFSEWAEQAAAVSDMVLVGEPERAVPAAVQVISASENQMGQIVTAQELSAADYDADGFISDIESLPLPAWDLAPVGRYHMVTLLSSRGCDRNCTYCPYVVGWGHTFRACSPRRVVAELAWLMDQFKPARVMFRDPVFAHDRNRVAGICEGILSRGLNVSWECESRPEHFDAGLLRLLQRAGCTTVKIGLESADPGRLVAMGRIASVGAAEAYLDSVREVVATCRQIGLRPHLFAMVGWPDEGDDEIEVTRQFLANLVPAHVSVKALEFYPGTPCAETGGNANSLMVGWYKESLLSVIPATPSGSRPAWRRGLSWIRRRLA